MKKLFAIILCLALTLIPLSGLAYAPENENILVAFLDKDPETLDGSMTTDTYMSAVNIFDRLVECETVDGAAQIVPGLATSWEVSEDGLTYTFHLAEGVKFHNGADLTADDVVYTVDRMMNPATLAKNTDFFDMIKGAKARYNGEADAVEGVVALDDYTVQITLEAPYGAFLANIATPGCGIYDRETTEAAGDQFGVDPEKTIGTGPFIATTWELGTEVFLRANENYFKGAPKIDGVRFLIVPDANTQRMLFETGEVDVFDFDFAQTQLQYFKESEFADQIVSGPRMGLYYYLFNQRIEPLGDARVRKALMMAVDRQAILDALFNGEGQVVNSFLPIGVPGNDPDAEVIPYDPAGAKALLAEAGYPNGFDLELAQTVDSKTVLSVNEVMQAYWSQIGVNATINQMDSASYYGLRGEGDLPSYFNSWSADFNDPDNFLYTFFSFKNCVSRSSNYANAEVQQLLEDARTMVDQNARYEAYKEVDRRIVHEDYAVMPVLQKNHLFCLSKRVEGFKVAWNGWSDMPFYTVVLNNGNL